MEKPEGKAILTKEILLNIPQDLRQEEIFYHICDYQWDTDALEEFEAVSKMLKSYQVIWLLWHLQGEVNNGGYFQYFDNFENNNQIRKPYYDLTIEYLEMIGLFDYGKDFSNALAIYTECLECEDDDKRDKIAEKMDALEKRFYENEKLFVRAIDDYINFNLSNFITEI